MEFLSPGALRRAFPIRYGVLLSVLALAACQQPAGGPPPAPGPQAVTVKTLAAQDVTVVRELPGRAVAALVAEVRPQVTGIVRQRLFTEGAMVQAGQVLYQLDDATARAELASAEAAVQRAQATLGQARLTANRAAELLKADAISKQDAENSAAALAQAQADLAATQAAQQRAIVMLGYTRITAPISGRIGKSSVTQGALVTANQAQALATIQQLDPIHVDVTQSSGELLALRKEFGAAGRTASLPVQVFLEDGSRTARDGRLAFADAAIDPTTGSVALRIALPNPDQTVLPGMYVRARIANGLRRNALLVPQQAIARDPKGNASAMVVGVDNKVEVRPVQVSRALGDQWLVDGGLKPGDRVIVEGLQKIGPGAPVVPAEVGSQAASPAPGPAASSARAAPPPGAAAKADAATVARGASPATPGKEAGKAAGPAPAQP